ncbi:Component of a membrane-bound complex containing the Tor2p kinase [Sporothrix eucalyptigena]
MSVLQVGDLVSYQLRTAYLNEVADGVGERLITLNESIVNSAPFKASGWRTNPGLIKRTHSPPIPTAIASEYFRAPRSLGFTLEDDADESGGVLGGGGGGGGISGARRNGGKGGGGGASVISGGVGGGGPDPLGPATAATKRRRRREQLEEEEDSSDLSDESDDEGSTDQRAAQQIKFAKMPIRHRSGSSPLQSSNLRNPPLGPLSTATAAATAAVSAAAAAAAAAGTASPNRPGPPRRGSQSALEVVKEHARRDTVTSSEMSSENEFDASGFHQQREREREQASSRGSARARASSSRLQSSNGKARSGSVGASSAGAGGGTDDGPPLIIKRQESDLLEEEREDDDSDDSDGSDLSSTFAGSIDSASILQSMGDNPLNPPPPPTDGPIVGTPPREFTRTSTVRRSQHPAPHLPIGDLPPPRPMSTIRPVSMAPQRSLLTAALKSKKTSSMPFDRFASLSGQGEQNPIMVRIYAPFSNQASKPFEVAIRPSVHQDQRPDRAVTVADLIGLSLWRYIEEKREPPLPSNRLNVNWWTLRMVEEGGEVDDDFPPLERSRPLASFTTANNNKGMRFRSNSKVYDDFGLVEASASEFADNKITTPQFTEEASSDAEDKDTAGGAPLDDDGDRTPRNMTPQPGAVSSTMQKPLLQQQNASSSHLLSAINLRDKQFAPLDQPRKNPILTTIYRQDVNHADAPAPAAAPNMSRGRNKLLRVHIHSIDTAPGQMVTVDVKTDTYLEEVLDLVCKRRRLDKASHVLKLPGSGAVVLTDRAVSSIGNVTDLDLYRKRFASEAPGANGGYSPSSGGSPKLSSEGLGGSAAGTSAAAAASRRFRKAAGTTPGSHPLAREALRAGGGATVDQVSDANYKKYTVWRRQGLKIMGSSERVLTIDGEYVHIMHAANTLAGGGGGGAGKITTVHFSNVVGCKVSLRHPTHFKLIVYKATESKRYDFEAKTADEAAEIVGELKKAMSPYRDT